MRVQGSESRSGRLLVAAAALSALSAAGPARASEAEAGAPHETLHAARPRLVVDYLPALVYENELVPVRLRVANPGEASAECTVKLSLHAGGDEASSCESPPPVTVRVEAGRDRPVSFDVPSVGWATAAVGLSWAGREVQGFWLTHFGEDEEIPGLVARGELLYVAETGDVAVLSLKQRTSQPDRQWYLWKRLASSLGEGIAPSRVLVLGAPLAAAGQELPAYLTAVRAGADTPVVVVPLPGETDRRAFAPVLADLARALETFRQKRPAELVVWVVACDDARRATPLWTFRKAADLLLSRARAWGAGSLAVLFVPEPAVPPDRRALYSEQLRQAALAYRAGFVRIDELEEARCWAVSGPGGPQKALGRYPNEEGHEALSLAVLEVIGP